MQDPPQVLPEEEYMARMEKIIRRDFFPWLDRIHRLTNTESNEDEPQGQQSLSEFLHEFESEDSHSFKQIMHAEHQDWEKKNKWLQDHLATYVSYQKSIKAKGDKLQAMITGPSNKQLLYNDGQNNNTFFFRPSAIGTPSQDHSAIDITNTRLKEDQLQQQYNIHNDNTKQNLRNVPVSLATPDLLGLGKQKVDQQVQYPLLNFPYMDTLLHSPIMTIGQLDSAPVCMQLPSPPRKYQYMVPQQKDKAQQLADMMLNDRKQKQVKKEKQISTLLGNTPLRIPSGFKLSSLSQGSQKIVRQLSSRRPVIQGTPQVKRK